MHIIKLDNWKVDGNNNNNNNTLVQNIYLFQVFPKIYKE
jgi:hypothetical protein